MRSLTSAGGTALAVAALGLALTGCGSNTETPASTSTSASSSAESSGSESSGSKSSSGNASTSTAAPDSAGANETIADYVKENGITETPVKRGDPNTPVLELPTPAGWEDAGANTPPSAWGAIVFGGDPAMATNPPTIVAIMSKLTGDVDQAKIFEYAPGELKNLPGFEAMGEGQADQLSGFDAFQIGGTYLEDGAPRMIAQKTVVIPATDGSGLFVLQLNASGTEDQMNPLMDATSEIDDKTVITQ